MFRNIITKQNLKLICPDADALNARYKFVVVLEKESLKLNGKCLQLCYFKCIEYDDTIGEDNLRGKNLWMEERERDSLG